MRRNLIYFTFILNYIFFLQGCFHSVLPSGVPGNEPDIPSVPGRAYKVYDKNSSESGWSVLPVRSEEEYNRGLVGGGAHQLMHGMARCRDYPEIVYAIQDVAGPWRSFDGGESWEKPPARGLIAYYGQSIAVDPLNPARVFTSTYYSTGDKLSARGVGMNESAGIYLSEDYGDSWRLVLRKRDFGFDWFKHRGYNENLVYSPASIDKKGARVWFAAFNGRGLYRSDNYGEDWAEVYDLSDHETIHEIEPHPTSGNIVYLASSEGLFISTDSGVTFRDFPDLLNHSDITTSNPLQVFSIEIDPVDPAVFWTVVGEKLAYNRLLGIGLYKTIDGGSTFDRIIFTDREGDSYPYRIFQSPSDPERLYLAVLGSHFYSSDKGQNWAKISHVGTRAPGLGRYENGSRIGGRWAAILPSAQDPDDIVYHGEATFWTSSDGGITPNETNSYFTGIAWGQSISSIAFDPRDPERFTFFVCDVGMKMTTTGGDWFFGTQPVSDIFESHGINNSYQGQISGSFDPVPGSGSIISSIGQYSRQWLVKSENLGESWSMYNPTTSGTEYLDFIAYHPIRHNIIYTSSNISRNGGERFDIEIPMLPRSNDPDDIKYRPMVMGFSYNNPDTVYATINNRVWRCDDPDLIERSESWKFIVNLGSFDNITISPIDTTLVFAVDPFDPDIFYFTGKNGDFGKYNTRTETLYSSAGLLDLIDGNLPGNCVYGIATDPSNKGVVYAATAFPGLSCMFKSKDHGKTWIDITGKLPRNGLLSSSISVNPHNGELFRGGPFGTWVYRP